MFKREDFEITREKFGLNAYRVVDTKERVKTAIHGYAVFILLRTADHSCIRPQNERFSIVSSRVFLAID